MDPRTHGPRTVELYVDTGCPNAETVRERLRECLAEEGRRWRLVEHRDAGLLSPSVRFNGRDVLRNRADGPGCRLDLPSVEDLCRALGDAERLG